MSNPSDPRGKRRQIFMDSIESLADLLAFMTAFLATPEIYARSVTWVVNFTSARYGTGFEDLTQIVWFVMTGLIVFFTARATIATAIVAAGLAAATRFI